MRAAAFYPPIALALELHHRAAVDESVQGSGGHGGVTQVTHQSHAADSGSPEVWILFSEL